VSAVDLEVRDVPDLGRYEARSADGLAGYARYAQGAGDLFVFTHTEVLSAYEGRGVGGTLVRGALDDVRRRGGRIEVRCPFVRSWVERHPDYQDLVVDPG
jgi:predicted GNAT family acetyltransferase